jgi:tetratricopeptide (TPR) repeat protein
VDTLDALVERRDTLRSRRIDDATIGPLLQRIVDHPDAPADPDFPGMLMDLAEWKANAGHVDEAIETLERAIAAGLRSTPDPRCDLADYHLRAGRENEAAALLADVRREAPDDVWLYNAAGLAYAGVGHHDTALTWLDDGLELAMRGEDPEDLVAQLADLRAESRRQRGRPEPDQMDRRVDAFLEAHRAAVREASSPLSGDPHGPGEHGEVARPGHAVGAAVAVFARGELSQALALWPDLRQEWDGMEEDTYLRAMDEQAAELRRHNVPVRGMALLRVEPYGAWARGLSLEAGSAATRSRFAADQLRNGTATPWPPGRNDPCWCGSGKKYKRCCASS